MKDSVEFRDSPAFPNGSADSTADRSAEGEKEKKREKRVKERVESARSKTAPGTRSRPVPAALRSSYYF